MGGCFSKPKAKPSPPIALANRPTDQQLRDRIEGAIDRDDYDEAERLLRELIKRKRDSNAFGELPELMDTLADVVELQGNGTREEEAARIRNDMRSIALRTYR